MHVNFASLEFINIWKTNTAETDLDFCNVKAIINEAWKRIDKTNRHIVKRFAVYVFYHILCSTMDFHFFRGYVPDGICLSYHTASCYSTAFVG